jgi:hypothetical protein
MGDLDEPKLKSAAKLFECVSRPSAGGPVNTDAEVNAACKRVLSLMQEPLLPSTHPMPRSVTNGSGSPATNGDGGSCAGPTLLQSLTEIDVRDECGNGANEIACTSVGNCADSIGSTSNGGDIGSLIASAITNAVTGIAKIFVSDSSALGRLSLDEAPSPLPASSDTDGEEPPSEITNAVTGIAKTIVSDSSALGRLSSDEAPPPLPASSDSDDEEPPPLPSNRVKHTSTGLEFTC